MTRYCGLILLAVGLCVGGCATSKEVRDPALPPDGGFPGPGSVQWEYKTVTLEGVTGADINAQLSRYYSEGWQTVNQYIHVIRAGLGVRATVPLKRLR